MGILNHQNLINICFVLQSDNKVQNDVPFPIYLISFSVGKLCSQKAELTGKVTAILQSKESHHGGGTEGARDMSKGALAPVGPRVESPLMARVVAMFTTMIKAPCKFVGCVCTRGISV